MTVEGSASRAAEDGPHHSETAPDTRMLDADSPVLVDSDTNRPEATNRSAVVATAADTAHRRHSWAPCGAMLFLAGSPSCSINLSAGVKLSEKMAPNPRSAAQVRSDFGILCLPKKFSSTHYVLSTRSRNDDIRSIERNLLSSKQRWIRCGWWAAAAAVDPSQQLVTRRRQTFEIHQPERKWSAVSKSSESHVMREVMVMVHPPSTLPLRTSSSTEGTAA